MLERNRHIPELYDLKNRNNKELHKHYDYDTLFIKKLFPAYIRKNPNNQKFLELLNKMWLLMYESVLHIKNFWNYTVPKDYDRHVH
jgi:hypothetical protein